MAASSGETECDNKSNILNEEHDVEECGYIVKVLEKDAFSAVVSAFRAQGMLTLYKQELLRHLKEALFITESDYHGELERAANDEFLSKVASTLNPSYDTYAEWELEGEDINQHAMNNLQIPIHEDADLGGMELADELLRLANSHNEKLDNCNKSLCDLLKMPAAPYVPERMRVLLRSTEKMSANQPPSGTKFSVAEEDGRDKASGSHSTASSPIKQESLTEREKPLEEELDSKIRKTPTPTKKPPKVQSLFLRIRSDGRLETVDPSSSTSAKSVDVAASSSTDSSLAASVTTADQPGPSGLASYSRGSSFSISHALEEDSNEGSAPQRPLIEHNKPSRKRKHQPDTQMCARVKPFVFEPQLPGCPKPIRGSPDRRASSESSTATVCQIQASVPSLPTVSLAIPCTSNTSFVPPVVAFSATPSSSRSFTAAASPTVVTGRIISPSSQFPAGLVIKRGRALSISGDTSTQPELNTVHTRNLVGKQSTSRPGIMPSYYRHPPGILVSSANLSQSTGTSSYSNSATLQVPGSTRPMQTPPATPIAVATATASGNQYVLASDVQRLVAQVSPGGQLQRTMRRSSLSRPNYVTNSPSSTMTVRNLQPVTVLSRPVLRQNSGGETKSTTNIPTVPILPQNTPFGIGTQLMQPATFRFPQGVLSRAPAAFYATAPSNLPATLLPVISRAGETQHIQQRQTSDDSTDAAVSLGSPENEDVVERRSSSMDKLNGNEPVVNRNPESFYDGIRLQCDEVMLPEQRCLLATVDATQNVNFNANSAVITRQNVTGKALGNSEEIQGGTRSHRLLQTQYPNGLTHQEGQNVISYVTAPQCIR